MATVVTFNPKEKVLKGLNIAADVVGSTLGPRGRNVFIDDAMAPKVTNDGATISRNIELVDKVENVGNKIVKNTCGQTNDDAGDGTTTTAVLLQAIVQESLLRPENPMEIRESLLKVSESIVKSIKHASQKILKKDIKKIALISAENEILAQKITEIIHKIGEDAVVTVEDARDSHISYELIEGYESQTGFMSTAFINDPKRARAVMTDVPVFISEKKIASISDIQPLFEQFKAKGISSAVIVCDDIENSILGLLAVNKSAGTFNSIVIKATGDILKDIEAVTGATRVSETTGVTFQSFDASQHLGHVVKIVSDANKTLFIPKKNSSALVWANHLQKFCNEEQNMYLKERLQKRISQLRGGVAVLKIGAQTDFEREYLKDKADDAVKASKVALQEGIVEGGGMTLWRIANAMKPKTVGEHIMKKALTAPLRKIIENAGKDYAEIIKSLPQGYGYDAKNDVYIDMIKSGIIDPAKVERCAVENSISNAANFITSVATITEYVDSKSV